MKLVTRPNKIAKNPNHNLWNNNGTWWIHYTLHLPNYTSKRIRNNLGTDDIITARMKRDMILHDLNIKPLDVT